MKVPLFCGVCCVFGQVVSEWWIKKDWWLFSDLAVSVNSNQTRHFHSLPFSLSSVPRTIFLLLRSSLRSQITMLDSMLPSEQNNNPSSWSRLPNEAVMPVFDEAVMPVFDDLRLIINNGTNGFYGTQCAGHCGSPFRSYALSSNRCCTGERLSNYLLESLSFLNGAFRSLMFCVFYCCLISHTHFPFSCLNKTNLNPNSNPKLYIILYSILV